MSETEETYDHAECMCVDGDLCRYHQALNHAETLAAEVARQEQVSDKRFKALLQIRSLSNVRTLSLYKAEVKRIVAAALAANPQAAPAPAERETA